MRMQTHGHDPFLRKSWDFRLVLKRILPWTIFLFLSSNQVFSRIENPSLILDQAFYFYFNNEQNKAKNLFKKYIEANGDHDVPLRYLSRISLVEGNIELAQTYLERAIKFEPKSITALFTLGKIYIKNNKFQKAIQIHLQIIDIEPFNIESLTILAHLHQNNKNQRKASSFFKRLILAARNRGNLEDILKQAYGNLGSYYYRQAKYHKAIYYYEKLFEIKNQSISVLVVLGELYKFIGKFDSSTLMFEKILEINQTHRSATKSLIELYYMMDSPKIFPVLSSYMAKYPPPPPLLLQAIQSQLNGNDILAKSYFEKVMKKNQNRLSAYIGLCRIFLLTKDKNALKKAAFHVIVLSQKLGAHKIAQKYMGLVLNLLREEMEENSFLTEFFVIESETPLLLPDKSELLAKDLIESYMTHAFTLDQLKSKSQALAYYIESMRILTQLKKWYGWQIDHLERDFDRNAKMPQKIRKKKGMVQESIIALERTEYQILLNISWILQTTFVNRLDESFHYLDKAVQLSLENPQAYFIMGISLLSKGEKNPKYFGSALKYFLNAINLTNARSPANYFFYLGLAYEKIKDFGQAVSAFRQAIEIDSYNSTYLNYLGYMLSVKGEKLTEARSLLIRALEDDPENEAYLDSSGWIFFKLGKYHDALKQLLLAMNEAHKKKRIDAVIYFHLAETYHRLNDFILSRFYYKKTIDNFNKSSEPLNKDYIEQKLKELHSY